MANIHFYLRSSQTNKKGQQSIIMRVTHNYLRPIFFIGFMVHPRYWSQLNQKVKPFRDGEADNNYLAINERINLFKEKTEAAINRALREEIPITEA